MLSKFKTWLLISLANVYIHFLETVQDSFLQP